MTYTRTKFVEAQFISFSDSSVLRESPQLLAPSLKTNLSETFTHPTGHDKRWLLSHHYALEDRDLLNNFSNAVYLYSVSNCVLAQPFSEILIDGKITWESFHGRDEYKSYLFNKYDGTYSFCHSNNMSNHTHLDFPVFILPTRWYQYNYYHWTIEAIPRLIYYKKLKDIYSKLKLVIHKFEPRSYQSQWLDLLEITPDDCYYVDSEFNHHFSNAYFVPILGSGHASKYSLNCLHSMMNKFSHNHDNQIDFGQKLFISRKAGTVRSIDNFNDINSLLKEREYKILYLEDLSVMEQITCIGSAKYIVGIHGSGLANLVAAKVDANVLELMTPDGVNPCFYDICSASSLHYGFITSPYSANSTKQQLKVNPQLLEDSLLLMENFIK